MQNYLYHWNNRNADGCILYCFNIVIYYFRRIILLWKFVTKSIGAVI